jgi:hypothetical protein
MVLFSLQESQRAGVYLGAYPPARWDRVMRSVERFAALRSSHEFLRVPAEKPNTQPFLKELFRCLPLN